MVEKFIEVLQTPLDERETLDEDSKGQAAMLGIQIETIMHSQYGDDQKKYADKARSLVFNLKDTRNPDLKRNLMNGVITAWDLVTMSVKDLASDAVKKQREKTTEINMAARRTDWMIENAKATIGFFTCKKCKSKNTTYFQMQTRGADEPMTNFITCKDCLTQWKS